MNELIEKVEGWARARQLHAADPKAQIFKVIEEFTETVMAFNDFKRYGEDDESYEFDEVVDGIGNTYVALIILCQQLDLGFIRIKEFCDHSRGVDANIVINLLARGAAKGRVEVIKSAVANVMVTTNCIANQIDIEPIECLRVAYDEIKDRKGVTINGASIEGTDKLKQLEQLAENLLKMHKLADQIGINYTIYHKKSIHESECLSDNDIVLFRDQKNGAYNVLAYIDKNDIFCITKEQWEAIDNA